MKTFIDLSRNYRVLRAISFLQPPAAEDGGVSADDVASHTGMTLKGAEIVCGHLVSTNDPWIYMWANAPRRYRVTTSGERELSEANDDPRLAHNTESWIDRVRWPHEERYSRLQNVAIPTGSSRGGGGDPDHRAWRQARGLLEHADDIDEEGLCEAWQRL